MTKVEAADRKALSTMFLILWAALVLDPAGQRATRRLLASEGFIMPKGPLKLTARGERIMKLGKS